MLRLIFVFFLLPFLMNGQHHDHSKCGVVDHSDIFKRLAENKEWLNKYKDELKHQETIYIPVKYHLVGRDDGSGRVDFSNLVEEVCFNNKIFEEAGFVFYIKDGVNEINDSDLYSDPRSSRGMNEMNQQKIRFGQNALNIFVTQSVGELGVLGVYISSIDVVISKRADIGTGEKTNVHEIGHMFGLAHTFFGWEESPYNVEEHGQQVNFTRVGSQSRIVELVDGSNCEVAADRICDTPPDYNFGWGWPDDCRPYRNIVLDRNGDTIVTSQNNIMSYFFGCDPIIFSPQQIELMQADLNSNRREYLRSDYVPNTAIITEDTEIIAPTFNQTVDFYNGVKVEWSPVANATDYYISIFAGNSQFKFFTKESSIYVTELLPNRTYSLEVMAYNETGGCADVEKTIFKTSDASTSTLDPSIVNNVEIYPNPVGIDHPLVVKLNVEKAIEGKIKLYDPQGKTYYTHKQIFNNGLHEMSISTKDISKGLYFLHFQSTQGQFIKKIIIQ